MNDELHPDALDDELRRRFGGDAASSADPETVLDTMRPRFARARSRRRASIAGAAGGVTAVTIALLLVLGGGGESGSVRTPPASRAPATTVPPAPTSAPASGSATADTAPGTEQAGGTTPTGPAVPDATPPTSPVPDSTPPTATSILQAWYTSGGGSITVELVDGRVSLTGSSPASGYTDDVHDNGPTRVEVRFSNGQTEWRIRVDVVNGQLQPEITQHG